MGISHNLGAAAIVSAFVLGRKCAFREWAVLALRQFHRRHEAHLCDFKLRPELIEHIIHDPVAEFIFVLDEDFD